MMKRSLSDVSVTVSCVQSLWSYSLVNFAYPSKYILTVIFSSIGKLDQDRS